MTLRPATPADLPAILDIYNHAVLHSTATAEYNPHTLDMRRAWYDEHMRDGMPILVSEQPEAGVVGWSSLSKFHPRYGYRFTAEDSVYIAEAWRGRGIGRQLVAPLVDFARTHGLHVVLANIDSQNQASLRLHARLGFVRIGRLHEVIYKFDRWLSTELLQLTLI
jgi:phosphinothricin acetyltransferase